MTQSPRPHLERMNRPTVAALAVISAIAVAAFFIGSVVTQAIGKAAFDVFDRYEERLK